ncbi:MAG: dihydroorotate dehydrogenase [Patescibacteria group bacterium]|nr:dihydroorotate dehydrogenase [Patescibacteria group bacterium]
MTASGTFGYGDELTGFLDVGRLGGIITKSLTYKPRIGNVPPRTCETPSGMLNSIGLANIGVHRFIKEKLPLYASLGTKVIVSIAGSTFQEYCDIVKEIESADGYVDGYEINISCPNTDKGGIAIGIKSDLSYELIHQIRPLTKKTLIAKLTPNVAGVGEVGVAVENAGADAVSLINTLIGMAINVETHRPKIGGVTGGLSGPCIKPVAVAQVFEVSRKVKIPVIGMGGISSVEDVIEFILAGAAAVQIGTLNFYDPLGTIKIIEGLEKYCADHKIDRLRDLRGKVVLQ